MTPRWMLLAADRVVTVRRTHRRAPAGGGGAVLVQRCGADGLDAMAADTALLQAV